MIKNTLIFSLLASFVLFSCSSDDDNGAKASIVGKWAFVNTVVNGVPIPYDDHEDCGKDYIELKADGTYVSIDVWDCEEYVDDSGTYTYEGNTITIDGQSTEVIKLTNSELSIKGTEDFDGDGTDEEIIINFERL